MKTVTIRLNTFTKVNEFVRLAGKSDLDIDLVSGRYVIDAKSIMGIFSLDLSKDIQMNVHYENEADADKFISTVKKFLV